MTPPLRLVVADVDEETPFDHPDVDAIDWSVDLNYVNALEATAREWCLAMVGLAELLGVPMLMGSGSRDIEAEARTAITALQERATRSERELEQLRPPHRSSASAQDLATAEAFAAWAVRDPAACARMVNARGWKP